MKLAAARLAYVGIVMARAESRCVRCTGEERGVAEVRHAAQGGDVA
jgi:hypothetical protein